MIAANLSSVADVFGDEFVHEEQALQLFEDLRDAMQAGTEEPDFLGSVVLVKP